MLCYLFVLVLSNMIPECGPKFSTITAEIPYFAGANLHGELCVHRWPSGASDGGSNARPSIATDVTIREVEQDTNYMQFTIPGNVDTFMWFFWVAPCKRPDGRAQALIYHPSDAVRIYEVYPFYFHRPTHYIRVTPSKIGLSSGQTLQLEGAFPHFRFSTIRVWFMGKKHNKTREATIRTLGKMMEVDAATWPEPEKVDIRVEWCGGGALAGHGHLEYDTEDSLFGNIADGVKEEDNPSEDLDPTDHKTVSMVEKGNSYFDPEHNQFVKTRMEDHTKLSIDMTFIQGIILLTITTAIFGCLVSLLHVPASLGHIAGGIIVGPGGFDVVEELIQVETIASLGVLFMLFELGMHFSVDKLRASWRAALGGGLLLTAVLLLVNAGLSMLKNTQIQEGLLFGIFASLSSTALTSQVSPTPSLVAILIAQDVLLALFLALVPRVFGVEGDETREMWTPHMTKFCVGVVFFQVFVGLCGYAVKWRPKRMSPEVAQTLMVTWLMIISYASELAGFSFELGSFVAGLTLPSIVDHAKDCIVPLRSYFGMLFFGAIGFVIHPKFLWDNAFAVLSVAMWLMISKFVAGFMCLAVCRIPKKEATMLSLRLAHVGEFGFVFASKGRTWGILTRHVYLLLVGATAISITSAPLLFALAKMQVNVLDIGLRKVKRTRVRTSDDNASSSEGLDFSSVDFERRNSIPSNTIELENVGSKGARDPDRSE